MSNRRGTAEIIGSVMFLLILLFFFANVYMWHDSATREMNTLLSEKMNSQISVDWVTTAEQDGFLNVTNNGGTEVALSRLWITSGEEHLYAELENQNIGVAAGATVRIEVGSSSGGNWASPLAVSKVQGSVMVSYDPSLVDSFMVLTDHGNTAACSYVPFLDLKGSITVEEDARPYNGTVSFSFSSVNASIPSFTLYGHGVIFQTFSGLAPGTYIITQAPSVWYLEGIFGATSSDLGNRKAVVVVVGGQSYYVRFVNTQTP
jgi:hypothetical protein